jgi:hypothetical protein
LRTIGPETPIIEPSAPKPRPERAPKVKNDPKLVAAARELRDRWLERVNDDPLALIGLGKYDLRRLPPPDPTQIGFGLPRIKQPVLAA